LLLAQLSVLRGAFGLELAQALFPDALVTMEILEDLERRSILQYLSPGEFRFQPRLREFVKERTADLTTAHARAIIYFLKHCQEEFTKDTPLSAFAEDEEAFYHLCQLGRYQDAYILVSDGILILRGHYTTLLGLYSQLHRDWKPNTEERQDYGDVCKILGALCYLLGQYQEALKYYQQSLDIQSEIGVAEGTLSDRNGEVSSLSGLGEVYLSLGQYQEAFNFFQQSLESQSEIGVAEGTLSDRVSLIGLGGVYGSLGQYEEAFNFYQQSLAIQTLESQSEIGDRGVGAISLMGLGDVYYSLGQYQEALKYYQQSLAIQSEIGHRNGEATSLMGLGNVYNSLGEYQEALKYYQQSLAIQSEIGDRRGEAMSLSGLGSMYCSLKQYEEALNFYQQSLEIQSEIGDRTREAASLSGLGNVYYSLKQYEEAFNFYQQSLEIQSEIGDRVGGAISLWSISYLCQKSGKIRQGRQYRVLALQIWQSLKLPVDVTPLPEFSKRFARQLEAQGGDWAGTVIQSMEQLGWLMDIIGGIVFLISLPIRFFQKFKTNLFFWFVAGLALTFLIWYLKK
jgi:tetratricopeptide (TPR) repeat protein